MYAIIINYLEKQNFTTPSFLIFHSFKRWKLIIAYLILHYDSFKKSLKNIVKFMRGIN